MSRLSWREGGRQTERSACWRARHTSRRQTSSENGRKLLALCHDDLRLRSARDALQRIEIADQRRGLCRGRLYLAAQRGGGRERYNRRKNAAESADAQQRRFRDVCSREISVRDGEQVGSRMAVICDPRSVPGPTATSRDVCFFAAVGG